MHEFRLPDLGEGVAEGELLAWHVDAGDRVAEDDVLAEVETDKAAVEVPSPFDGVVQELAHEPGDVIQVGEVLVTIDPDGDAAPSGEGDAEVDAADDAAGSAGDPTGPGGESAGADGDAGGADAGADPADGDGDVKSAVERFDARDDADEDAPGDAAGGPVPDDAADQGSAGGPSDQASAGESSEQDSPGDTAAETGPVDPERVFAPPHVRQLARELDIELGSVDGSGPGGRVTAADVEAAAGGGADEGGDARDRATADDDGEESSPSADDGPKSAVSKVEAEADAVAEALAGDEDTGASEGSASADDEGTGASEERARASAHASDRDRTLAAPATRRVARELDVDLNDVPTERTSDGEPFVTEEQVRTYAAEQRKAQAADGADVADAGASETDPSDTGAPDTDASAAEPAAAGSDTADAAGPTRREPYRGIRRRIGEQMSRARTEVPHATHHDLAVVEGLVDAKERLEPLAEKRDVRLTFLPFLLKAVAAALRDHPVLNTELDAEAEEIVYKEYYNLGVATATEAGLMVPVVEDVDQKGVLTIAREINALVAQARDRSIDRADLQGSTFTVTNVGAIGGEYADPVINVPETAILATGALRQRPVVADGDVVARHTIPLSLAIDHRVIDGADAARFTNSLKEYLSDPRLLLLD